MFYHIEGNVTDIEPNLVVLDCGGVGFAVNATATTISQVSVGKKQKLYISESVGENNFDLYGFASRSEKSCFEMLISVSGIGPKAGLSILSCNTPEALALAIMNSDEKALTVAPGIGKKIAQRVILELKDKIGKQMQSSDASFTPIVSSPSNNGVVSDAMTALSVLGYSNAEIAPVLKKLDTSSMTAEAIIKTVLKNMVK